MNEREMKVRPHRRRTAARKQQAFEFPDGWGGVRKGAGPKPRGDRPCVSHRTRDGLERRLPAQVTLRVKQGLPSLRGLKEFAVLRGAMVAGCKREGFRLVHFSVQSNHLHLIVEGDCRTSLSRGLQGLAVRMARSLNRLWKRFGRVFADRSTIASCARRRRCGMRCATCCATLASTGPGPRAHAPIRCPPRLGPTGGVRSCPSPRIPRPRRAPAPGS